MHVQPRRNLAKLFSHVKVNNHTSLLIAVKLQHIQIKLILHILFPSLRQPSRKWVTFQNQVRVKAVKEDQ